jgi:hypothetical protein
MLLPKQRVAGRCGTYLADAVNLPWWHGLGQSSVASYRSGAETCFPAMEQNGVEKHRVVARVLSDMERHLAAAKASSEAAPHQTVAKVLSEEEPRQIVAKALSDMGQHLAAKVLNGAE